MHRENGRMGEYLGCYLKSQFASQIAEVTVGLDREFGSENHCGTRTLDLAS